MSPLILVLIAVGLAIAVKGLSSDSATASDSQGREGNPLITRSNPWNLPDVDSALQADAGETAYDEAYEKASGETLVPFALIKAHAIRESLQDPGAYHYDDEKSGASYGLLQVEWLYGSDRFAKYGLPDSEIGTMGDKLYDPETSARLGALIIRDNLNWLMKTRNLQTLRDTINAYNTGKPEAKFKAPNNYVNDVLNNYSKIIGEAVTC